MSPPGTVLGIDVSSYQPLEDWATIRGAGIVRAYCKATEGITYKDETYFSHMNGARDADIQVGAYHFWRPNDDATAQAEWFLKTAGTNPDWLPACLDVEVVTPGIPVVSQVSAIGVWLGLVTARTGIPCVLYTNPATWQALGNPTTCSDYPLWVADYGVSQPAILGGWGLHWMGWQYTDKGQIAGISGDVDLTYWRTT